MVRIAKPLKDLTDFDAKEIIRTMVQQALHEELNEVLVELKRIADALDKKKP